MSPANKEYIVLNNQEIPKNKIEVNPNSIEPRDIKISKVEKRKIREKYNLPLEKSVFIYGGNLGKPQGIDFLIKCINMNENNFNSYFLIVGSGTEYIKLKKYFERKKPVNSKLLEHLPNNRHGCEDRRWYSNYGGSSG